MPGVHQHSADEIGEAAERAHEAGVQAVLLFGIPAKKDEQASGAYAPDGVIQRGIGQIKKCAPELTVITDVCLCEAMEHGHCGVVRRNGAHFEVCNDETLELLAKIAVSHAAAGADMIAPSDMMDGRIGRCRAALDEAGFEQTGIISYAAKFASAFYAPFREAAASAPQFGDRR